MTTLEIPLGAIVPSPTNPRKTLTESSIRELADSIAAEGLLQNIAVREIGEGRYELIAGERRWRAMQLLERPTIRADVHERDDLSVRLVQLVENLQREDLDPMEEAAAMRELTTGGRISVPELARRIGRKPIYCYQRIALLKLPDVAASAVSRGELAPRVALVLTAIPDPAVRAQAASEVLRPDWTGRPMTRAAAEEHIHARYCVSLAGAPWDQADATVLGGDAPACVTCPYRSGNMEALQDEGSRTDICTRPECYAKKCEASKATQIEALRKQGVEPLPEAIAARLGSRSHAQLGGVLQSAGLVDASELVPEEFLGSKHEGDVPTWREVAKQVANKKTGITVPLYSLADSRGKVHVVANPDVVVEGAVRAGLKTFSAAAIKRGKTEDAPGDLKHDAEFRRAESEKYDRLKRLLFQKRVERLLTACDETFYQSLDELVAIVELLALDDDNVQRALGFLSIKVPENVASEDHPAGSDSNLHRLLNRVPDKKRGHFVRVLLVFGLHAYYDINSVQKLPFDAAFEIDYEALQKSVEQSAPAAKEEEPAAAKKRWKKTLLAAAETLGLGASVSAAIAADDDALSQVPATKDEVRSSDLTPLEEQAAADAAQRAGVDAEKVKRSMRSKKGAKA